MTSLYSLITIKMHQYIFVSALSTVSEYITTTCLRMSAVKVECTGIKQELPDVVEFTAGPWVVQDIKLEPLLINTPHTAVSQYMCAVRIVNMQFNCSNYFWTV